MAVKKAMQIFNYHFEVALKRIFVANDSTSLSQPGLGKNGVKKMGGWHRLSAEGKRRHKKTV